MSGTDPNEVFLQEARELLEVLEQTLLDLEQAPRERALIDTAFRALHTLKGSGAMFGFDEVAGFVHDFETAFDELRHGESAASPALIAVALSAKDHIANLITEPGRHAAAGEPILSSLRTAIAGSEVGASVGAVKGGWHIRFKLPADAMALGSDPLMLLDQLRELGSCEIAALSGDVPPLEVLDPAQCYLSWDVKLSASCDSAAIEDVFLFLRDDMELAIAPLGAELVVPEQAGPLPAGGLRPEASPAPASASLRVPAERLDELMDRVGEMVIAQARLAQIAAASEDGSLKTVAEDIERLSAALRDTTMGIRMVPIGTLFGRFRRLMHDLSSELGKEVNFVTSGEETELDKTVIERLADPLVHIIRNSVDHGLETAEARSAAGKPPQGTVKLAAVHQGAEVAISISDDGAGLDTTRIRAKAVEAGLIAPDATPSDQELHQMIFHPGFSTAQEVTSISGRGVGMDVVRRTIDGLRGTIDVNSTPGAGTTVTLRLPLTLAIIEGMLVRVGKGRYSIPLSAVEECVELPAAVVAQDRGRNFLNIRGSLVPFLRLRELFKCQAPADLHQNVVVVAAGEQRVGLVVDQILGNSQTVIKSLSKLHASVETFSGATILGDGTVALILDVGHLVRFGQNAEERLRQAHSGRAA